MLHWTDYTPPKYATYKHGKRQYVDLTVALDTENSSYFFVGGEWVTGDSDRDLTTAENRIAVPYIWQIGINNTVYYGRDLRDLKPFLIRMAADFGGNTVIIYVHNLGYDFEFIAPLFSGWEIFARKSHRPIYARLKSLHVEFRCSLFLTGMKLDSAAKSLGVANQKLVGGLDYKLGRTPETPLTARDMQYCEQDITTLIDIINVYKNKYGCIANIPYTQTGEVRRVVKSILSDYNYRQKMHDINNNYDNYKHLTRLFAGGVTHLNYLYNGVTLHNVYSYDRRSSYPAVMCLEKFPRSAFTRCAEMDDRRFYLYYGLLRITNLRSKSAWDYIAEHKCEKIVNGKVDNGKLFRADEVLIWVTDIDYDIINDVYNMGSCEWIELYRAISAYLPIDFVRYILQLYHDKTALKNVPGRENDYAKSKQYINSLYGMTVTNNIRDDVIFDDEWDFDNPDYLVWRENKLDVDTIKKRLGDEKPFLPYSVGVWVTAYARRELYKMIVAMGNNCVYCDTDSVKGIDVDEWQKSIDDYNADLRTKIDTVCRLRNLPRAQFSPTAPDGTVCTLGEFALDGIYSAFKSYGAKKYCVVENGKFSAVIAGCEKTYLEYAADGSTSEIPTITKMSEFTKTAVIAHGRKVHFYTQNQPAALVRDYLGNTYQYPGGGNGIVIMDSNYTMGLSQWYSGFLDNPNSTTNFLTNVLRDKL